MTERTISSTQSTPSVSLKKTDTPFRERMPALICHTLPK